MHLSDLAVTPSPSPAKGDSNRGLPERAGTLRVAAEVTGYSADRLKGDHVANICGGAAVLASYQPATTAQQPAAWSKAVALYAGSPAEDEALEYADMVFDVLGSGARESTDTGDTVTLAARPGATVDTAAVEDSRVLMPGVQQLECPSTIECEYDDCVRYIQTPDRFVSWHYTIRSDDGHVAQHVANRNVAAHAGNWYLNMHSIGFEHGGFAAERGRWYAEALYRSSRARHAPG